MLQAKTAEIAASDFSYEHASGLKSPIRVVGIIDGIQIQDVETGIYYALDDLYDEPTYRGSWDSLADVLQAGTVLTPTNGTALIRPADRPTKLIVDWTTELHTGVHGHLATATLDDVIYLGQKPRQESKVEVRRRVRRSSPRLSKGHSFDDWSTKTPDKELVGKLVSRFAKDAKR